MSNTLSSDNIMEILSNQVVTVLQNRLASLAAFSIDYKINAIAPRSVVNVPIVSGASAVQTDPTNFETGDNTIANIEITPHHISKSSHIGVQEMMQSTAHRVNNLTAETVGKVGDAIMALALAPLTTANFTATPVVSSAAAFGADELKTLYGQLAKSPIKHALLDSTYYARFLPATLTDMGPRVGLCGFDAVIECSSMSGAGTNVVGFACNPQAVAIATGRPLISEKVRAMIEQEVIQIPGLNLAVEVNHWASTATRIEWMSLDVMFGAAKGDGTSGVLIKSA